MAIRKEDLPKIDERIELALKPILNEIKSLRPQGWRKAIFWLREAGILVAIIGAFVGLLGITAASIYRAVTDVREEANFRTNTKDRLDLIEKSLTAIQQLQAVQNPGKVLKGISDLDSKTFTAALPVLRKVAEQPTSEVSPTESTLHQIATQLRNTSENTPEYWPTVLQFINFASASGSPPGVPPPGKPNVVMSNSNIPRLRLKGRVILFDGSETSDSVFENCRIIFTGNPTHLQRVTFINCVFEMPIRAVPSQYLQQASKELLASNFSSVTIASL